MLKKLFLSWELALSNSAIVLLVSTDVNGRNYFQSNVHIPFSWHKLKYQYKYVKHLDFYFSYFIF